MIYSDEDKISTAGVRHTPLFKPELVSGYLSLPDVYLPPRGLPHCAGKSDWRFPGRLRGARITTWCCGLRKGQIKSTYSPRVLYSWREIESSTAINAAASPTPMKAG